MGPEANVLQSALRISSRLFWNVASCLCLSSTQQFSPFPVRAITCNRPGNAESEDVGFVVCWIASKCIQQYSYKEKPYSPRYHTTVMRIGLWNTFIGRRRHFFSEWMVTLTMTDGITRANFTQWTNITNHQPAVHRFTGGLIGLWQTKPPHINKDPFPLSILTARQGRQTPATSQLKRLDTRYNRHWLMQRERVQCSVCSTKNKETKQNSRVENATQGCVLPNVSRYITPNCMSEDQMKLKQKSGTHKRQ